MNAYYVKEFVGEKLQSSIQLDINSYVQNFKYQYNKKFNPEKSLKTLSLIDINKIFNEWSCKSNKINKIDYNNLVDKILYLSKSYNVNAHEEGKSQKMGQGRKKRKIDGGGRIMEED